MHNHCMHIESRSLLTEILRMTRILLDLVDLFRESFHQGVFDITNNYLLWLDLA